MPDQRNISKRFDPDRARRSAASVRVSSRSFIVFHDSGFCTVSASFLRHHFRSAISSVSMLFPRKLHQSQNKNWCRNSAEMVQFWKGAVLTIDNGDPVGWDRCHAPALVSSMPRRDLPSDEPRGPPRTYLPRRQRPASFPRRDGPYGQNGFGIRVIRVICGISFGNRVKAESDGLSNAFHLREPDGLSTNFLNIE